MAFNKKWFANPVLKELADGTDPAGVTGSQGNTGIRGLTGSQGQTGAQGTTGVVGAQGATGIQGTQGTTGTPVGGSTILMYVVKIGGDTGVLNIANGIVSNAS